MPTSLQAFVPPGSFQAELHRSRSVSVELKIGRKSEIVTCDAAADALFAGFLSVNERLAGALHNAEKAGHLSRGAAVGIMRAISLNRDFLFGMRDGRTFMMTTGSAPSTIRFSDVTFVVHTILSKQRDTLTGLPNRVELIRSIQDHLDSGTGKCRGALLFLDLDKFKFVNDTLGHPIGDALLKLVTGRVAGIIGPTDVFARLGGDEFVILQQDGEQPAAAEALASRLIDVVGRTYLVKGQSLQVGVSIGIALLGRDGTTPEGVIRNADLAMLKAKAEGRSKFCFFTDAMDLELQRRRTLEIDLQRALLLDQFHLMYQPQFEIRDKRLIGFEALIRWSNSEGRNVSPADFIPVAEEIGLIDRLGDWVLRRACVDAASWSNALSISVNVSPLQFRNTKLTESVLSALALSGLEPNRLDIEITEGALMDDTDSTVSVLTKLKALGIKISMDDFGTGYSSLSYLQKFPFDKIKIDQSFIRNMDSNKDSASIVRAIVALGTSLGMTTIAEGVETETQLTQITYDGCQQVQGYLTGRPVSAEEAKRLASN